VKITESDVDSPRGELALDLLRSGSSISIERFSVRIPQPGEAEVIVWSEWGIAQAPDGAEEKSARDGARQFEELVHAWPDLRALLAGLRRTFLLGYDYGNGSVVLGRLSDDGRYTRA
jgi:hypothetical protein